MSSRKVLLGLSGGVDSSVSAFLLKEAGWAVEAVFMKNWAEDDGTALCTAEQDFEDAKSVADALAIPLHQVDLSYDYWTKVFQPMLEDYQAGLTPNPDILCNRFVKFGVFADYAEQLGASWIATGHYAKASQGALYQAKDRHKDQSYFLYAMPRDRLGQILFPLGDLPKPQVREIASKVGLVTAKKKDSTGICFVGPRSMKSFLGTYLEKAPGPIETLQGQTLGTHEGLWFYTLGQSRGLGIGGVAHAQEGAWYVIDKNWDRSALIVDQDPNHPMLYQDQASVFRLNWLVNPKMLEDLDPTTVCVRLRHTGELHPLSCLAFQGSGVSFTLQEPARAITPGQSAVFYHGLQCLGGGVISAQAS